MPPKPTVILHDFSNLTTSNHHVIPHHGIFLPQSGIQDSTSPLADKIHNSKIPDNVASVESIPKYSSLPDCPHLTLPRNEINYKPLSLKNNYQDENSQIMPLMESHRSPQIKTDTEKICHRSNVLDKIPNEVLTQILSYLSPNSIVATSLVSKRFNKLVTTPHVWRIAFSRFFPEHCTQIEYQVNNLKSNPNQKESISLDTRLFTRLTDLASWRSEYILRTRLLCCLSRGRPARADLNNSGPSRRNLIARSANPVITYSSGLFGTVNHIHAIFDSAKSSPRFIHGTDDTCTATTSDPSNGKFDRWKLYKFQELPPPSEAWPGYVPYGLYDGPTIVPNSMDVSQIFGVVVGEGFPRGRTYYQSSNEMLGRFLHQAVDLVDYENGIPRIPANIDGVSAVWIAKSHSVPRMTHGLIGMLRGSTLGVVTAYSFGFDNTKIMRAPKGSVTAKWVLSPGVPIIAFDVDDSYNSNRKICGRVWAAALNALGEVFYLTQTPSSLLNRTHNETESDRQAWNTGRTVYWHMIEASRRVSRDDPYHYLEAQGSYFPRSSSMNCNLTQVQLSTETREIETYFQYTPSHFRKTCYTWDMRRKLHVDFGGDDSHGAGEAVFVIRLGDSEGQSAEIQRMTRVLGKKTAEITNPFFDNQICHIILPDPSPEGIENLSSETGSNQKPNKISSDLKSSQKAPNSHNLERNPSMITDKWQLTFYSLASHPGIELTCTAIDMSTHALLTASEDPINCTNLGSGFPISDEADEEFARGPSTIPGHRARILATGTKSGSVIIWNMRGPLSSNLLIANKLNPLRVIHTDSPQISCIAVSSLYIVHGGNDGLVQAWDPLASNSQPIRTLNSRSTSSYTRRLLAQNDSPVFGLRTNPAAGAVILDPNPTRLRGIVSVGTQLRYWAYSSSRAEEYQRKKCRRRPYQRGANSDSEHRFIKGRGDISNYIAEEQEDLSKEELRKSQETTHLFNRFGVGLYGLTEEEATLYAELISAEDCTKSTENLNVNEFQSSSEIEHYGSVSTQDGLTDEFHNLDSPVDNFERDLKKVIQLSLLDA